MRPKKKKGAAFSQSGVDTQAAISVSGADCTDTKAAISDYGADCTDTTAAISVAGADFSRWCGRGIRRPRKQEEIGCYKDELPGKTGGSSLSPRGSSSGLFFLGPGRAPGGYFHTPNNTHNRRPSPPARAAPSLRTERRPKRRRETRTTTVEEEDEERTTAARDVRAEVRRLEPPTRAPRVRSPGQLQTDSQTGGDSMRESERWCVQHERAETTNALTCQIILLRDDAAGKAKEGRLRAPVQLQTDR